MNPGAVMERPAKKDTVITLKISGQDKERIKLSADADGVSVSEWIRRQLDR